PRSQASGPSGGSGGGRDQTVVVREDHQLHTVAQVELRQQAAHVRLDGVIGDEQLLAHLAVRASLGDQQQHLPLAVGEPGEQGAVTGRAGTPRRELRDHPPGDAGGEQRIARGDHPHGMDQLLRRRVLEQEAAGPRLQGVVHVVVDVEGGEHQDPWWGRGGEARCPDALGRLDPVHLRHAHVHEDHVRSEPRRPCDRLPAVGHLPDHAQVLLCVEQGGEAGADHGCVVGDQHGDGHVGSWWSAVSGRRARTVQPPSGSGPCSSVPASRLTRSCIPRSPVPGPAGAGGGAVGGTSLCTRSVPASGPNATWSSIPAPGAWRPALLSASCATRYAVRSTVAGSSAGCSPIRSSTLAPARRKLSTSSGIAVTPCSGASSGEWSSVRSTPSSRRISVSEPRALWAISSNSAVASGERSGSRYRAVEAWTWMSAVLCATTSWS